MIVLDTCAIIAFLRDEDGADVVATTTAQGELTFAKIRILSNRLRASILVIRRAKR